MVKRPGSIRGPGNIEVLFTDKTGTLTEGRITFAAALDTSDMPPTAFCAPDSCATDAVFSDGHVVGGNQLDSGVLGERRTRRRQGPRLPASVAWPPGPFHHESRLSSVLVEEAAGNRQIIVKGAPESLVDRCSNVTPEASAVLERYLKAGSRVIGVASQGGAGATHRDRTDDEHHSTWPGS